MPREPWTARAGCSPPTCPSATIVGGGTSARWAAGAWTSRRSSGRSTGLATMDRCRSSGKTPGWIGCTGLGSRPSSLGNWTSSPRPSPSTQPSRRKRVKMKKLKMGMVGGGKDALIGAVHRRAALMDGEIEFTAGALSSTKEKALASGRDLGLPDERNYGTWQEMLERELELP